MKRFRNGVSKLKRKAKENVCNSLDDIAKAVICSTYNT